MVKDIPKKVEKKTIPFEANYNLRDLDPSLARSIKKWCVDMKFWNKGSASIVRRFDRVSHVRNKEEKLAKKSNPI